MAPLSLSMASVASMLAMLPAALAGFNPASNKGVALYWGQNSHGQGSGEFAQQRLSYYCANSDIDIIPIAFMNGISPPVTNFANAGDNCTKFSDNANVLNCPQIEADIKSCQAGGKTIILSLGGATYTQGGWGSAGDAENAAQMVWDMFGPVGKNVDRPFGSAVVDGFDFDFESPTNNLPAFGKKLRSLMDGAGGKKFYLAAAPQCVFPDAANQATMDSVPFDFLMIQFYNNWCGVSNFVEGSTSQNAFNFNVWDNWAKTTSPNKNIKLMLGIPGAPGGGGGYTNGSKLKAAIEWSKAYSSFGGVMAWDISQVYSNAGFLKEIVSDLAGGPTGTNPPGGGTPTSTSSGSTPPPTGNLVPHWGQCGGQGWTGPTQCQAPYKCVSGGQWWASCQ